MAASKYDRPPLRLGTYPVTLGAGNWHDILTALEWAVETAARAGTPVTAEAMDRIHGLVTEQVRRKVGEA